jgi:phage/plasmid primase-like uncharacterized protein
MLGICAGSALRLAPAGRVLALAEGIETALSVMQATAMPTWAALSGPGLASVVLPPFPLAEEVLIFADYDDEGMKATQRGATRFVIEGRKVRVALPPRPGLDFNDVLRGIG